MTLSEREARLLADIEGHLTHDDARLARRLEAFTHRCRRRLGVFTLAWLLTALVLVAVGNLTASQSVVLAAGLGLAGAPLSLLWELHQHRRR